MSCMALSWHYLEIVCALKLRIQHEETVVKVLLGPPSVTNKTNGAH